MTRIAKSNVLFVIALLFFHPSAALSHDGWVEITPTIVEKGQVATIALIQGNHSNEHRSYRIAGKWDQKYTTLAVVDPNGKQNALTDRLIDLGEDDEKVGPKGPKGFFLALHLFQRQKACTRQSPDRQEPSSKAKGRNW